MAKTKASTSVTSKATVAARAAAPVRRAGLMREIDEKMARVWRFLREQGLGGLLITQVRNFSWLTAGIADNHIVITTDIGAASLFITPDGGRYLIADNIETPRLMKEDLKGLGFKPIEYKWFDDRRPRLIREIAGDGQVASDIPFADFRVVESELAALRYQLTDSEIEKYRWLGRNTAEAVAAVCKKLRPGMSEREIEARASDELMRRVIRPTVLLIGADDRIYNFRHAPATDKKLKKYAMINVCARRWGLVAAITRFVHFGPLPEKLRGRLQAAANVNAQYQAHTRPGAKAGDIFEMAKTWYRDNGFEGESDRHHQGGAIGYGERDWFALPGSTQLVQERQGFAWNPTVQGAKVEDTIIVYDDHVENITGGWGWPMIAVEVAGSVYRSPDILIRKP